MTNHMPRVLPLALLLALGCAREEGGGTGSNAADSRAPAERRASGRVGAGGPVWALSSRPLLTIGDVAGRPEYEFQEILGAIRLSDGRLVVADGGDRTLRWYGPDGTYLRTAGRRGGGPGEFESMAALFSHGDTVVVFDRSHLRVSLFSPEGEFARSFRIPTELGLLKGVFGDGSFLLGSVPGVPALPEPGHHRPRRAALHLDPEGRILDSLGVFPDFEHVVRDIPVSPGRGMRVSAPPPFGRETLFAACGDVFAVGDQTQAAIPVLGMAGEPRLTIRWTAEDRLVTEAAKAWYREKELREARDDRERFAREKRLEVEVFPDSVPPYRKLLFDQAGRLWVEAYKVPPGDGVPWRVFDGEGRPLGRAEVPGDLAVLEIGPGYLLGRSRDGLGVESLRVFGLSEPTGGEHGD